MEAKGLGEFYRNGKEIVIIPSKLHVSKFSRFVFLFEKYREKYNEPLLFDINLSLKGFIVDVKNKSIFISPDSVPEINIKRSFDIRSLDQNNTYYGILYFMFWAQNGRKPTSGETDLYNDALMEMYAPEIVEENPLKPGEFIKTKKRQSKMTTVEFSRLIDGALTWLAEMDIPEFVHMYIGTDMEKLWKHWYLWRNSNDDILSKLEPDDMTYEEYKKIHPVCELTNQGGTDSDPVVRMHLVANLQSSELYDQPWSYIRAKQSIHVRQHNEGWKTILKEFPHLKIKYDRAQEKAFAKGKVNGKN